MKPSDWSVILSVRLFMALLMTTACSSGQLQLSALPTPTAYATQIAGQAKGESSTDLDHTEPTNIRRLLPPGDSQRGEQLLEVKACSGCHLIDKIYVGPSWKAENYANGKGIGLRAKKRWQQSNYTGNATNATEYLFESMVSPNIYVIEGYMNNTMPTNYGETLTLQDVADIIAFLLDIQ